MNRALVSLVRERARHCCEYCQLPQAHSALTFPIDHIIAKQHGGRSTEDNLALSCFFWK
jgi:5-methylcytosine-specific restriction endonuclease McrA